MTSRSLAPDDVLRRLDVALTRGVDRYPSTPPFHPDRQYPEYPHGDAISPEPNPVYDGVRRVLHLLGLDRERFGTPEWNPLGEVIEPGELVVLKPNFVRDFHDERPGMLDVLVTHGSVIRAIADYVAIALRGRGRIVIADSPQNDAVFENIARHAALDRIERFFRSKGIDLTVRDLRQEYVQKEQGVLFRRVRLAGDPLGYRVVRLDGSSAFAGLGPLVKRLRGAEYDMADTFRHHDGRRHEYLIAGTVLAAQTIINLPKLKTHKKSGLTATLKNSVGVNGDKNWLPHHREGVPREGGDQYADSSLAKRLERFGIDTFKRLYPRLPVGRRHAARAFRRVGEGLFGRTNGETVRSGNWHGNDTIWRTVLDLNRALLYADADGVLRDRPVRKHLSIIDAVVAGEGNGPLAPEPKACGLLLAGLNPVAVDLAACRLMGFDWTKVPKLAHAFELVSHPLIEGSHRSVKLWSNEPGWSGPLEGFSGPGFAFAPHFGWKGHIEIAEPPTKARAGGRR